MLREVCENIEITEGKTVDSMQAVKDLEKIMKNLEGKMPSSVKKGEKAVNNMASGTYELIFDMEFEDEVYDYASGSMDLSAGDVGLDEDDPEWIETVETWDMVMDNAYEIAAYTKFQRAQDTKSLISKIIGVAIKNIKTL